MWISKAEYSLLKNEVDKVQGLNIQLCLDKGVLTGENRKFEQENIRMRADLDWFKLRLNMVEKERAQLIAAAIGVKVAVPEFVQTFADPVEQLQAMSETPDLSFVGGDFPDGFDPSKALGPQQPDYSIIPTGNRN